MALKTLLITMVTVAMAVTNASGDDAQPDPGLLEFLGRVAGLEGMGIDIDTLLAESLEESQQPEEEDNDNQS